MKMINATSENFRKSLGKPNVVIVLIGSFKAHGKIFALKKS